MFNSLVILTFDLFKLLAAMIANFEEGQNMRIKFEPEWISEAEHLSLRFKVTIRPIPNENFL